jgi:hypothetical protein
VRRGVPLKSATAAALALNHEPIAIIGTNEKPPDALQFREGKIGCVIDLLIAAVRGRPVAFSRTTCGCPGGGTGLGFGNQYKLLPGGEEAFCYFLSVGAKEWERGKWVTRLIKPFINRELYRMFTDGERYIKSPDLARRFLGCLPMMEVPYDYIVFKPLGQVTADEDGILAVMFLVDNDQLSAMVCLANYDRDSNDNVITPWAAGCQSIGIYPFAEAEKEKPKAVIGLVDIYSRVKVKRQLKSDVLSFAVPYGLYLEMEGNVPGSFLEGSTWRELTGLKTGDR